jgi:hypothetical protein
LSTDAPRLDLTQPRELGALFRDSLRIYFRNFGRFIAIGAAVVVPAELIVSGVGLGQLSAGYDHKVAQLAAIVPLAVQAIVTTPLVVAMTVFLLLQLASGSSLSLGAAMQSGLDAFRPIFVPVIAMIACVAALVLALVVPLVLAASPLYPFTALIPLVLYLRWYFIPQTVVVDGARGLGALRASFELTRGFGWRVFGVVFLGQLGFGTAGALIGSPIASAAKAADSGALQLAASIVGEVLAAPAVALLSVLLYFDLKARASGRR